MLVGKTLEVEDWLPSCLPYTYVELRLSSTAISREVTQHGQAKENWTYQAVAFLRLHLLSQHGFMGKQKQLKRQALDQSVEQTETVTHPYKELSLLISESPGWDWVMQGSIW